LPICAQVSKSCGPIVGATKLQHLDDALASVRVKLSEDEMTLLEEPYVPHAVVGSDSGPASISRIRLVA
jgi:aryl-alcohol dehydrogenase-like predicted oxidoreductase